MIRSIIAWSRVMDKDEIIVAFNNDLQNAISVWVTIDNDIHQVGDTFKCHYSSNGSLPATNVAAKNGKSIWLSLAPGGIAIFGR